MATAAYNSPKPVLDNRFIRVYYYRAPVGNVAGQRGSMIGSRGRGGRGGAHGRGAYKTVNNGNFLATSSKFLKPHFKFYIFRRKSRSEIR